MTETFTSYHLKMQVRKQRRQDQGIPTDPIEVRVRKFKQTPPQFRLSKEAPAPQQVPLTKYESNLD